MTQAERDRRKVATGANLWRMRSRAAKRRGITLAAYMDERREQATERAARAMAAAERQMHRLELKAKREEMPDHERTTAARAANSGYIMRRYHTEPVFREHMKVNARRASHKARGVPIESAVDLSVIAKRDGWRCHICGRKVSERNWSLDHLIPVSKGGTGDAANLALAHRRCNSKRGAGRLPAQLRLLG